ncbi:MAG TPA: malate synthase A [Candidatus Obscuribacterales bacterium]
MARAVETVGVAGKVTPAYGEILSAEALNFFEELHRQFNPQREQLLAARHKRMAELNAGKFPDFLPQTANVRDSQWRVAEAPADLLDRRVEITGPVERKMMINALNSGANVFMADFEDANSPTWQNVIEGQLNCREAVRRSLSFKSPEGKEYKLNEKLATLVVRPRGWHLLEKHIKIDGQPVSASLFDFAMYFFHNAHELIARGSGPYFYLPKMESHLEARLWNDVFNFAQDKLNIPRGTIRATVLIETILAAFEMDEILFELRDHAAGLNAGRWDYIFSMIKKFSGHKDFLLPDRAQVTMNVPFMKSYCNLLVKTCHRRAAHAMGGMAAFIPSRKDHEVNERALLKVREDKDRETSQGFDGTWVAHPDLVPVAKACFDVVLGDRPNQKDKMRDDVQVSAGELLNTHIEGSEITAAGVRANIDVALQYIESWLRGIGAAAIHNLMEDAATAEISRAQLWQWIRHGAKLNDGRPVTKEMYETFRTAELSQLTKSGPGRFAEAAKILDSLVNSQDFVEFLTIPAYAYLNDQS